METEGWDFIACPECGRSLPVSIDTLVLFCGFCLKSIEVSVSDAEDFDDGYDDEFLPPPEDS